MKSWSVPNASVQRGFRELAPYAGQCRFHNCRHLSEPGCAVAAAVASGDVDARRLASYRTLLQQQALEREKAR